MGSIYNLELSGNHEHPIIGTIFPIIMGFSSPIIMGHLPEHNRTIFSLLVKKARKNPKKIRSIYALSSKSL